MTLKLTEIARKKLENYFDEKDFILDEETKKEYSAKKACFVTLTKDDELRGCVGSLVAHQALWKDVLDNIMNAAFSDNRFKPLEKKELNKIKIEISVLSEPERISYKDSDDLLKQINNKKGIILKKGFLSATFLPQVWEQIPFKKKFLEQLSLKAGLDKDSWKEKGVEILYYSVDVEKED